MGVGVAVRLIAGKNGGVGFWVWSQREERFCLWALTTHTHMMYECGWGNKRTQIKERRRKITQAEQFIP